MKHFSQKQSIFRALILIAILATLVGYIGIRRYLAYAEIKRMKYISEHGLPVGPPFVYPPDRADKIQLLNLLKAEKFQELTTLLEEYQKDFERDFRTEYTVFDAFDAFSTEGPMIEPYLDEWVSRMPHSYCPYLARGAHYNSRGWASRGYGYASETSEKQFEGMELYFEKAQKDFDSALKINPNLLTAYVFSGDISSASGKGKSPEQWFREGEKRMPYSLMLRTFYMGRLAPKWGGSYSEMEDFADECDRVSPHNPNLKVLRGYIHYDKGMSVCGSDDASAVKEFTKALKYGEFYLYLEARARCIGNLQKNKEAMADLDRAVKLRPQRIDMLLMRAERLIELKRFQEGRNVYNLVSQLDPESRDYLRRKDYSVGRIDFFSFELYNANHLREAMNTVNEAQQLDPTSWGPYYFRAGIYYAMHDRTAAFSEINKAIELCNYEFSPYTTRNHFLKDEKNWDQIIKYMDEYIAVGSDKREAYFQRAWAEKSKGDVSAAQADFKKACELGQTEACGQVQTSPNH